MALRRIVKTDSNGTGQKQPMQDCELSVMFPTVMEFLSLSRWEDGSVRQPGTITLLVDGAQLKAALNDRDAELSAFVSARTLTDLLQAVEAGLISGCLDWRDKTPWKGRPKPRGT